MKIFFSIFLSVFVLLIAAALIAPQFIDWNSYKAQGLAQVKTMTGYDVSIDGDLSLSVFPAPHVIVNDVAVKSPQGGDSENLLTLKRAAVYVALSPLFQGKLEVAGVRIDAPHITMEIAADGSQSWMTPEIEALQAAGQTAEDLGAAPASGTQESDTDWASQISVDRIDITDGRFVYRDEAAKSETIIDEIDFKISAETLFGPFDIKGSLQANGQSVDLDVQAQSFDAEAQTLPLNVSAQLADILDVNFAGVAQAGDNAGAQGQITIAVEDLQELSGQKDLPNSFKAGGLLSADAKKVTLADLKVELGSNVLGGKVSANLDPVFVSADIRSQGAFALEPLLSKVDSISFKTTAAQNGGSFEFRDTALGLGDQSVSFDGSFAAGVGDKRSKLTLNVASQSIDIDKILGRVGQNKKAAPSTSGASSSEGVSEGDIKESAAAFEMPIDLDLSADVKTLVFDGKRASNLKANINARRNSVVVNEVSVSDFSGATFDMTAALSDIKNLSGIEGSVNFKASDVRTIMSAFDVDTAAVPPSVKALDVSSTFKGDLGAMNVISNIKAAGAQVIAKGAAKSLLSKPELDNLVLQVKHPNLNRLIGDFAPDISYASFSKPLDFYTVVSSDGEKHELKDMKIDLAGTPITGHAQIDLSGDVPSLGAEISAGNLIIITDQARAQAAARSSSGAPVSSSTAPSGAPRWTNDKIDTAWMHDFEIALALKADSLTYETFRFDKPSLGIDLKDGTLNVSNLKAGLYDGNALVNVKMAGPKDIAQPVQINIDAELENVQLEELVTSLLSGVDLVKGRGGVSLKTDIQTSGRSQNDFVTGLSGKGVATGQNFVIEGIDLTRFAKALDVNSKPGDTLQGLWAGSTQGGSTAFDTLDGTYEITGGVVNLQKMDLDGTAAAMETRGTLDLPKWRLDTTHKITAKEDQVEGEDLPSFEFSFEGPLDNPAQTFAQGPLQNYLQQKISRKLEKELSDKLGSTLQDKLGKELGNDLGNLVGGLLGGGRAPAPQQEQQQAPAANDNAPQGQQQQQQQAPSGGVQPEDAIRGVLEGLF